jgi:hypothetical protein
VSTFTIYTLSVLISSVVLLVVVPYDFKVDYRRFEGNFRLCLQCGEIWMLKTNENPEQGGLTSLRNV